MFGRILGAFASAPVRLANIPVRLTQKAAQAADEFMLGSNAQTYRAPEKNVLDRAADAVSDSCKEAFGDK
jgi:hypothetical protein